MTFGLMRQPLVIFPVTELSALTGQAAPDQAATTGRGSGQGWARVRAWPTSEWRRCHRAQTGGGGTP